MKKVLTILISFFFYVIFLTSPCIAQTISINITEEVIGTVPELTWGANLWNTDTNGRLDGLPRSGITLGRIDMSLQESFRSETDYDFIYMDRWIGAAKANGIVPLMIVGYMPTWLSSGGTTYDPPSNMTKFLNIVEIAVNHVKNDVIYYEIWNEPNIHFWTGTEIEYRELLVNVSQKIRELDPDAIILAPALSDIASVEKTAGYDTGFNFTREVCVNATDYFDIFSFHLYSFPEEDWPSKMDNFIQRLTEFGCGNKPLWMTESPANWHTLIEWNYLDVLSTAQNRKFLLDHNVKAQVYFPFRTIYTAGGWWVGLYDSSTMLFTPVGKYYQLSGKNGLKFYGDKLKINSNTNDNVSEVSFISVKNSDNNIVVQLTNNFPTSKDVQINFLSTKNITVYESSSDRDFDSSLYSDINSRLDLTLKPYSVYLIEAKPSTIPSLVKISGQLRNTTGLIQANVSIYNQGTDRINISQVTSNGNYDLTVLPGVYDIQYNILNIPNFFIKLISFNIISNLQNIVNYVNKIGNSISFTVDITGNQGLQVYSEQKPSSVKVNGTEMTEVSSLPVSANTWFYNSTGKRLHMIANPTLSTTTTTTSTTTSSITSTTTSTTTTTTKTIIPGYIFEDGFESGNFNNWTGISGAPIVVSTQKYEGTYSFEGTGTNNIFCYKSFANQTTVFVRGYFRFSALPITSGQIRFMRLYYGSGAWGTATIARIKLEYTGTYGLTLVFESYYPSPQSYSYPISMNNNTWYPFEIKFVKHATNGEYRVWFNGNEVIALTGLDTSGSDGINSIALGHEYVTINTIVWTDSVKVSNKYIGT